METFAFAYIQEITEPLIKFLQHAAGLRRDLLARHVVNVEFWVAEAAHCLHVMDDYPARFQRLREAARKDLEYHWDEDQGYQASAMPTKSLTNAEREVLRGELCDAVRRFLNRAFREGLLDGDRLAALFTSLGMQAPGKD